MKFKNTCGAAIFFLFIVSGCSNTLGPDDEVIPSTSISFSLEESGHVKLWVENAYKTTVISLIDEHIIAGHHTVNVLMADEAGNRLPDGIYTYHLETNTLSVSRILVLSQ